MQFTLHATCRTPHGASRLVQPVTSAWLVKTRRAPSRHSRDARVYGHTTTTIDKFSTPYDYSHTQIEYTPSRSFDICIEKRGYGDPERVTSPRASHSTTGRPARPCGLIQEKKENATIMYLAPILTKDYSQHTEEQKGSANRCLHFNNVLPDILASMETPTG